MKKETFDQWKDRTKKRPKILPTREAKGVKKTPSQTSSHMGTKTPTHAWWKEDEK